MTTRTAPPEVIIGLDVGTTGTKAVAFAPGSSWRATATREYPLRHPEPDRAVQDPDVVVDAALAALAEVVTAVGGATVLGLAVCTAMHGLVGLDADQRPRTPLVTWADGRAAGQAAALRGTRVGRDLHRATGTPIHPMSPLTKLAWFNRHEPELARTVRWWIGLKDWVLLGLTGALVTERSSASGTGMLDMHTGTWHPAALELAGVVAAQLPEPRAPTTTLPLAPEVAARTGIPAGTPVVLGAADGPLGNLATRAMQAGVVGMSIGTSGAVRMVLPAPPRHLPAALFAYHLADDAWVVGGAVSNGGAVTRWVAETVAPDLAGHRDGHDQAVLALGATAPAGSDGLVMLPHLLPERGPLWDPSLEGAWLGLRRHHTRAHLVRAAVEGVALQLALLVDGLAAIEPVHEVRATGGVLAAPLWREVVAATLDRPLVIASTSGGTARAAAALGLYALGHHDDLLAALADLPGDGDGARVEPDAEAVGIYRRMRARIPALVQAIRPYAALLDTTAPQPS